MFILGLVFLSFWSGIVFAGDIAVIVNPENQINSITQRDLRKILLYEKTFWKNGSRIFLVLRESGSREKKILMKKIYKMNDEELKKLWLSKLFKGEIPSPPKIVHSDQSMKLFVERVPTAIGFIDSDLTDDTVKILRVDGKHPGEESYVFKIP